MYCTFLLEITLFACYYILIIYRYKSLDLKCISNTNDNRLPIKPKMAAILDLFFNETLKVTNGFINKFSIKNHVKLRYYIKMHVKLFSNYNFNMALVAILNFAKKKRCFAQGKRLDFLQVIKEDILSIF